MLEKILLSCLVVLAACSDGEVVEEGETLEGLLSSCEAEGDCGEGLTCECGVCTVSCAIEQSDCEGLPGESQCEPLNGTTAIALCGGVGDGNLGLCLPSCTSTAQCAEGLVCVGHCIPPEARPPRVCGDLVCGEDEFCRTVSAGRETIDDSGISYGCPKIPEVCLEDQTCDCLGDLIEDCILYPSGPNSSVNLP